MARSKSAIRHRKARIARREANLAAQSETVIVSRGRNMIVLGMLLACKGGNHGDEKKARSKSACRKKKMEE